MPEVSKPTKDRFVSAYIALGLGAGFLLGATTFTTTNTSPVAQVGLRPITNSTWPNLIEPHFAGRPLHTFPANLIPGMPEDGYCRDWSNKSSWRVFVCMGTQPESQP